jgi:MFS superfamily sulfate permease-like transporter
MHLLIQHARVELLLEDPGRVQVPMTLRISQFEDQETGIPVLKIEGALTFSQIDLLEQAYREIRTKKPGKLILDVSELTFVDFESADVIRRIKKKAEIILRGCGLFTSEVIERPCPPSSKATGKIKYSKEQ